MSYRKVYLAIIILTFTVLACSSSSVINPGSKTLSKYEKGRSYYEQGEYDKARDILYKLVERNPYVPEINYYLGMSFARLGGVTNRTYAVKYLKNTIKLVPDSIDWRFDLGTVLVESDMKMAAHAQFNKVIEQDSNYLEAYSHIIDYCLERFAHNNNYDKLSDGYKYTITARKRFPLNNLFIYKQALIAMLFKSDDSAEKILREIFEPDTLQAEILMLDGYLKYKARDFGKSFNLFADGAQLLSEKDSKGYFDITLILHAQGKRDYEKLSELQQKHYADSLWDTLDPDLTTALNEKYVEHFARVFYAELIFNRYGTGRYAWDTDMGQLYIRYGPPVSAKWNLPEDGDPKLNCFWDWVFIIDGNPQSLRFINLVGGNKYQLAPIGNGSSYMKAQHLIGEHPRKETFAQETELINSYFSYFIYKDDNAESKLDLFVATPYDQFKYEPLQGYATCEYEYRTALLNLDGEAVKRDSASKKLVIPPTQSQNPNLYTMSTISMTAPPESLTVAFGIEQKSARRVNVYNIPVNIFDFSDDGFHLSSLILGSAIGPAEEGSLFNRREYKLTPNFTNTYENNDTLIIYYEMTDLPTNLRGRTKYLLSYSIKEIDPPGGVLDAIGRIFTSNKKSEISHIEEKGDIRAEIYSSLQIDLSSLKTGYYEFNLNIEEQVIGKTLSRKARFSIVEESE
jgi:GWxTD domain-containing protein